MTHHNELFDDMLNAPVIEPKRNKVLSVKITETEQSQYRELMDIDVDMPCMIREFIRKMHIRMKADGNL